MTLVWISKKLVIKLYYEVKHWLPLETGGILMGYEDNKKNLVITNIIKAGPESIHERNLFVPDGKYQQKEISKTYFRSNGIITYLGDWHSHPNSLSYMSDLDYSTIRKISKTVSSKQLFPIFIIIGTSMWEYKCWRYINGKLEILKILLY